MKHLKSSLRNFRELFESSITAKDIAEPFTSFDFDSSTAHIKEFMELKDFDIIGIRKEGLIAGYVCRRELSERTREKHLLPFTEDDLLSEKATIIHVFHKLQTSPKSTVFVTVFGQVTGIITRGDLQKIPVRMWLFGLISLIEMQLLRIIRAYYPTEDWKCLITDERLNKTKEVLKDRQKDNIAIDLSDCLQFSDKYEILLNKKEFWQNLSFPSKTSTKKFFNNLKKLRDRLSHAQDIITGKWPIIVDLIMKAEKLLDDLEQQTMG